MNKLLSQRESKSVYTNTMAYIFRLLFEHVFNRLGGEKKKPRLVFTIYSEHSHDHHWTQVILVHISVFQGDLTNGLRYILLTSIYFNTEGNIGEY